MLKPEAQEQKTLVNWLEWNGYKFTAIPNSTFTKSWHQKHLNKITGLRAGLPDILVVAKIKALIFIELKRPRITKKNWQPGASPSKVSDEQKEWIQILQGIDNVEAHICYGSQEAIDLIVKIDLTGEEK